MKELRQILTSDGARGFTLSDDEAASSDARYVRVRFDSGQVLLVPIELLEAHTDGLYHLPFSLAELESRTRDLDVRVGDASSVDHMVVPIISEELDVAKRVVTTGVVRVHKLVQERTELVDEALLREEVVVERVPLDRVVDTIPTTYSEGDTLIIPVVEEVLVVEKRLLLKEEVRITKRAVRESSPQEVTLRSERVEVERLPADELTVTRDERVEGA